MDAVLDRVETIQADMMKRFFARAAGYLDLVFISDPIQHACPGMDLAELKQEFGERVIFHDGVDNQAILPRGTVEEVRAEVKECLRALSAGREGFMCCSCHNVQPGTPIDNVLAMVETVRQSDG